MCNDEGYSHAVGQQSKMLVDSYTKIADEAEAARKAGDQEAAERLDREAKAHLDAANILDRADEDYAKRNEQE